MNVTEARQQSSEAHGKLVDAIDSLSRVDKVNGDGTPNNLFAQQRIDTIIAVSVALDDIAEAREAQDLS